MPRSLKRILIISWTAVALTVTGASAAAWLLRDKTPGPPATARRIFVDGQSGRPVLKPLFQTPTFLLRNQDGKSFSSVDLSGKVWIADFVFTNCTGMCPIMTQNMRDVQTATAGLPVQLVSFTVDPDNDTPAVLKNYAQRNKADPSRWHFLTGAEKPAWDMSPGMDLAGLRFFVHPHNAMWDLSVGMKLAVGEGDSAMQIMHSSRFLLVDGRGTVRGVYDYKDPGAIENLLNDTKALISMGGQ